MRKRMLIVDASLDHEFYKPVEQWMPHICGVGADAVHLPSMAMHPQLDRYTHVLLTGSQASFEDPLPWFDLAADLVRDAMDRDVALLGSCFGHQMLVWALSGPTYVRRALRPELGWIRVDVLQEDRLLANVPNPWHSFAFHLDEVVEPPGPWRVLAKNEACAVQAIRYGEHRIWGIQPHPETNEAEARRLMEMALDLAPDRAEEIQQAMNQPVLDDGATPQLVRAFLES